ncbi:MAG: hypothetical protein QNI99_04545 [Woeseiaceae bacterium]|nr:hypothetical protein [Woeseiaceae bacterium]
MKLTTKVVCSFYSLLTALLFTTASFAEEYDFELDVAFGSSNFDGSKTITRPGGTIFNSGSNDSDNLSIFGNWYYNGLSDDNGPRARAALVNRASSLSFGYGRTEQTIASFLTNTDPSLMFIPSLSESRFESDSDLFSVDLRHVDRDSGWFGSVGLQITNEDISGTFNDSTDATEWRLGAGKYIFENTTLSFSVGRIDFGAGEKATAFDFSLEHLGNLGDRWQYGLDIGYDRTDLDFSDFDTLGVGLSLYPNRDFEFGVAVLDARGNPGLNRSDVSYEGFASWFIRPNIQLSASYRVDDADFFGNVFVGGDQGVSDADSDSFGISATWRFD